MMKYNNVLLKLISGTLVAVTCAFTQAQPGSNQAARPELVVGEVLKRSNSPAGLEVISGCETGPKMWQVPTGTTEEALNNLALSEGLLTWDKGVANSYRAVIRYSPDISLGSIHVPPQHIEAKTLTLATDLLLANPAIQAELVKQKFTPSPESVGFSSIRQHDHSIDLPAGTLGDDLTLLASEFGGAVWQLDQRTCGSKRTFRITWILR